MDIYAEVQAFFKRVKTEKRIIGKTYFGRDIYAVKMGEGQPVGIAQYGIHGREYITAKLAFAHYVHGVKRGSYWLIPLANPDGALLSQVGIVSVPKAERGRLIDCNRGADNFSLWKANGRGVDLNVNFAARWGKGAKNSPKAGAENGIGTRAFSERETQALRDFTREIKPDFTVSYHTKGEEIYWRFYQSSRTCPRDFALAKALSASTGYPLKEAKGSVGGYKDWCIQSLKIPAFTVETGRDSLLHPIGEEGLQDIIEKNEKSLDDLIKEYKRILCGN